MDQAARQFGEQVDRYIATQIRMQWVVLREAWEPMLKAELLMMAEHCAEAVVAAPTVDAEEMRLHCEPVLSPRLTEAKKLLARMVGETVEALGEALTMGGLTGQAPRLGFPEDGAAGWADRLAGGAALEEAVRRGLVRFCAMAAAEPSDDPGSVGAAKPASPTLEAALAWWQRSLAATAATLLHGVFNRTQRVLSDAL